MSHIKTFADRIETVEDMLAQGFTTKSAKKDAMFYLRNAFEQKQDALDSLLYIKQDVSGERIEGHFKVATTQLHHFKPEHIAFYAHHLNGQTHEMDDLQEVLDLRDQVKAAEIGVKTKTEEQLLKELEQMLAAAAKDDGFRTNNSIDNQFWYCENENGSHWYRCDWYLNGDRTAFWKCSAEVATDYRYWKAKGAPNMKRWSWIERERFYNPA